MGPLPASGKWVRLEVPARSVGLEGAILKGMAFTLWGGQATWDYAGKRHSTTTTVKSVSGGIALSWPSEPGQLYRILCKTNLFTADWTEISGPITATDSTTSWTDTSTSTDPQRFYQVTQ
jgi:hypothetical protein